MAETVNLILESMLPHLEELQQIGIFTEHEIKAIIRKRRQMEYKLFRRPPRKEDFLKAIQYEINLDKLRKIRKERLGVINGSNDSEFGISNRIHALYGRASKRFKGDVQLWQERISYAKQLNQHSMVSRLYGQALAIHPSCVKLWLMAAKFEFEDRKDVNASRSLFQQGLRVNQSSKKLWIEYYRMELMAVDKLRKRSDVLLLEEKEMSDEVLNFAISSVVYEEAIKAIPNDVEFRLTCLSILDLFDSTEDKQREIYDNVMKDFPNSGLFHDFTAKCCWKKITDSTSVSKIRKLEKKSEDLYVQSIHELSERNVKEELCILWERYIHWNIERLEYWRCRDGSTDDISNRVSCLLKTSMAAASNGILNEESALKLISILQSYQLHEVASDLMAQLISVHPSSVDLWLGRLHCEAHKGDIDALCREALSVIPKESALCIWQFWINHAIIARPDYQIIEAIFQECIDNSAVTVVESILQWYLDWMYVCKGIDGVRSLYENLSRDKSHLLSVQIFMKFIDMEKNEIPLDIKRFKGLYEAAVDKHGSTSPDLWIEYITLMAKTGRDDALQLVSELYWRAIKILQGPLVADFITKHSLRNL